MLPAAHGVIRAHRIATRVFAMSAICLVLAAGLARGDFVEFEAEWYDSWWDQPDTQHDDDIEITIVPCDDASGLHAVVGVDRPGEWIAIPFNLERRFCFVDSVRSAGSIGFHRWLELSIYPIGASEPVAVDSVYTIRGEGDT